MSTKIKTYTLNITSPLLVGGVIGYVLNYFLDLVGVFGRTDSYVYYYSYSTIVQGFVALVAFTGALAIFKLQRDQDARQRLVNDVSPIIQNYNLDTVVGASSDELISLFERLVKEPTGGLSYREEIKKICAKILELAEAQRLMTIYLKRFAYVCLADVAIALLGIPLTPYLNSSMFGPILLGGTIALSLWVLNLVRPIIQRVLWLTP